MSVTRRVWAPRGVRPTAWVNRRFQWRSVSAFIRPTTGQSWWCLLPTVSTEAMRAALAAFAHDERIDARHRAVLVLDGAHVAYEPGAGRARGHRSGLPPAGRARTAPGGAGLEPAR
ncbi:MAG: hypothetical protein ACR2OE_16040 [Thermomicrobiales bacterium]